MKNRQITLMDLGLDEAFNASMTFVQSVLSNVNAGYDDAVLDVDFVRSRDPRTIASALTSDCSVLHVMAHGDHSESPAFVSSDDKTQVNLDVVSKTAHEAGLGIVAGTVIADGCKTGTGVWQRAIRDCLETPVTYIVTSTTLYWHQSTVFCSAFYGALTRNRGRGKSPAELGLEAAQRAAEAYEVLTDTKCPFKAMSLEPSRKAKAAFGI